MADAVPSSRVVRTYSTGLCVPARVKEAVQAQVVAWVQKEKERWEKDIAPNMTAAFAASWKAEATAWVDRLPRKLQYPAWRFYNSVCGAYERLYAEGVRKYCEAVSALLTCKATEQIFENYYLNSKARTTSYSALRGVLPPGESGKLQESARYLYHNMAIQTLNTCKKLDSFKFYLFKESDTAADFTQEVPNYLFTRFLPFHFKRYLTKVPEFEKVTPEWIRNVTVGWRRRLDPVLPAEFQMEQL
ncbi:MAG: hypothetical protein ACTSQ8_06445, partial [Candidatus Helarchaeota archaeon]